MNAITTRELATILGYTPRTIQAWARERRIPHLKIGRTIRFLPEHVEEIRSEYARDTLEQRPDAHTPNPGYTPYLQVVPMQRRDPAA